MRCTQVLFCFMCSLGCASMSKLCDREYSQVRYESERDRMAVFMCCYCMMRNISLWVFFFSSSVDQLLFIIGIFLCQCNRFICILLFMHCSCIHLLLFRSFFLYMAEAVVLNSILCLSLNFVWKNNYYQRNGQKSIQRLKQKCCVFILFLSRMIFTFDLLANE